MNRFPPNLNCVFSIMVFQYMVFKTLKWKKNVTSSLRYSVGRHKYHWSIADIFLPINQYIDYLINFPLALYQFLHLAHMYVLCPERHWSHVLYFIYLLCVLVTALWAEWMFDSSEMEHNLLKPYSMRFVLPLIFSV